MIRAFLALPLFAVSLAAIANDRVYLELSNLKVVMSEETRRHMRSGDGLPEEPMQAVELHWTDGNAVLPDDATSLISLYVRFQPDTSVSIDPTNRLTILTGVSGRLTVHKMGVKTDWTIEQENYGIFFANTQWFYDEEESIWRLGVHLPLAFLREADGHRVVGHMFVALSDTDEQLTFNRAWILPRLGGNPPEIPDPPSALFTRAFGS